MKCQNQRRIVAFLFIWPLKIFCYDVNVFDDDYDDSTIVKIKCEENEYLDSLNPIDNSRSSKFVRETPSKLEFHNCPPPNKTYIEILKEININVTPVTEIFISNMVDTDLLTEYLFVGMSLRTVSFSWDDLVSYDVTVESNEHLDLTKGRSYFISCGADQDLFNHKPVLPKRLLNVSQIEIFMCPTPNESYFDILQKLNINPHSVEEFSVEMKKNSLQLEPRHFKALSLRKLTINSRNQVIKSKIFEEFAVDEVFLTQVELETLPKTRLKVASLEFGVFVGAWGDCSTLMSLSLNNFEVPQVSGGWLRNCRNLTEMTFKNLSQNDVDRALMNAQALIELSVNDCYYNYDVLDMQFASDAVNLRTLKFLSSRLAFIDENTFSALKKLEVLDLSDNKLEGRHIFKAIFPLTNLRTLIIDRNPVAKLCGDFQQLTSSKAISELMPGLERVSLRKSPLSSICFQDWHNLTNLNLSNNKISELQLGGLPVPRRHPLTVDLTGNPLTTLPDTDIIEKFKGSQNVTILLNLTVACDCEHSKFLRNLRNLPQISLLNATCNNGETLKEYSYKKFGCNKYPCDKCKCRTFWNDGATVADCQSKELQIFPEVWTSLQTTSEVLEKALVMKILASGNIIETLPELKYPESLLETDLHDNKISRISQSALTALFHGGNRRVHLSENPFICDCEAQDMIDVLSKNEVQIPDYRNLTCSYSGQKLFIHELVDRSLCTERALVTFGIVSLSLLALAAITAFIFVRYKLTIKAFLYARGLCLSCVREEELDADREYDAFVSFAHSDEEFVADVLLPGLENDYKLCVHMRNWIPGEMIHTQIMESVQKSRRTIIVLSKSFVESVWGMTEFHTAYSNSLREGRVRVICVVVDDVIDDVNLDSELKSYLMSNTYLKFNDPWFWQKLRYAMPHPSVTIDQPDDQSQNTGMRCEETEMMSI